MPATPPRLDLVFQKYDPPLFFVTFNTHYQRRLLANAQVNNELVLFAKGGEQRGIAVGRYVIMPDHIHLFVSGTQDFLLTQWVRLLKRQFIESDFGAHAPLAERLFRPPHPPWRELFGKV